MSHRPEIQKQFRQQQEKLIYYVIALCVASIGFAINKTTGQPLKMIQIPLGISIISWVISIFLGIRFIKYSISSLFVNDGYLRIIEGQDPLSGNRPDLIQKGKNTLEEILIENSRIGISLAKWQERLFYSGIISFIVWHILEMYSITPQ